MLTSTADREQIARSEAPAIRLRAVQHAYGRQVVVQALSFSLQRGQIGCLLGPSGCGKTTVLRGIAGFERPVQGEIALGGRLLDTTTIHIPPEDRRVGMVFQDYALFPHLTVRANIAFGLTYLARPQRAQRVDELLDAMHLTVLSERYPHELSGGQQQRVALARALAPRPEALLLDEPFSNLDADLRDRLSSEVREVLKREGTTAILVTHDQHEAFAMADEIGVMHEGRLQQWGSAYDLYHRPANRFVADFVGEGAFVPGRLMARDRIQTELGMLPLAASFSDTLPTDCGVEVLLRPDDVVYDAASPLKARVVSRAFRGAEILYRLELPGADQVLALVPSHHHHAPGEEVGIRLDCQHVVAFPRQPT